MIPRGFFFALDRRSGHSVRNLALPLALGKRACRQILPAVHQAFTRRIYELALVRP